MNAKIEVPLRVDFAGSWLDVPSLAKPGACIVNCAIQPLVSLSRWPYEQNSGLGGSAAWAALNGVDPVAADLKTAGWQDPAVILETGLCVWRSGTKPVLEAKFNPDWLIGHMVLIHTGKTHKTADVIGKTRNYSRIIGAADKARYAVYSRSLPLLANAVNESYLQQIQEGMERIDVPGAAAVKYCGSGFGGYLLCLFNHADVRVDFVRTFSSCYKITLIEPYLRSL